MRRSALFFLATCLATVPAFAETIELVTYYPASSNAGNLHVTSLTVGTAYGGITPGDGTALIADQVGIGTNDPQGSLHVVGPNNQADNILFMPGTGTGTIRLTIGNAGLGLPTAEGTISAGDKLVMWSAAAGPYKAAIGLNTNNELWLQSSGNNTNNKITFYTSSANTTPSERMRIDANGNVGIGIQNPVNALHINRPNATIRLQPTSAGNQQTGLSFRTNIDGPGFGIGRDANNNGTQNFFIFDQTAAQQRLFIDSTGNVGIGTTTPGQQLSVQNNAGGAGTNVASFLSPGITNQMDILIGSQRAAGKCLSIGYSEAQANGWVGMWGGPTPGSDKVITFNGTRGNVGIMVPPSAAYRLDVAGQAHATGFPTSSDIRLKTHVVPLSGVLEKLDRIRPVQFDWNDTYKKLGRASGHREIGVVAQDVEAVFPELVTHWGEEDYRAVDYGRFTAVLLEAVKELKVQNEKLRNEMNQIQEEQKRLSSGR